MSRDEQIRLAGLDLLEQQIAVLNAELIVVRCSSAWHAYAQSHAPEDPNWKVGGRFLEAFSSNLYTPAARSSIAAALRAALAGTGAAQSASYSCGDAAAPSWYCLSFRKYMVEQQCFVLVAFEDITVTRRREAERKRGLAETKLQAVVAEHTDRGIIILDPKAIVEWVNPGFTQLHGYSPSEVIGKNLSLLCGLGSDSPARKLMERRMRAGVGVDVEALLQPKVGKPLWIRTEIRPVRSAAGFLEHFVAIEIDITESKLAAERLARERELLNTIVNGVPHLIVWMDRELVLRGCNQQYAIVAGLDSPAEIVGRTVAQLPLIAKHADRYNRIDRHIIETGTPALRLRETQRLANGEERVVMMNRMPLRLRNHSVGGVLAISEDITEDERAAQKMREDEERWMLALEVNDVAVWDFDVIANTVVGSARWTELLVQQGNWRPESVPLPAALIHADDLPHFKADWDALLLGTLPALESGIRLRIGDSYRHMRLRGRVVRRDRSAQALRVVGTMVDIHEATLKQMQTATASKLESIGQLAAGIAHEINTPTQYVGDNVRFLGDAFAGVQTCIDDLTALMEQCGDSIPSIDVSAYLSRADIPHLREEIPKAITQSLDGIQRIARIVGAMKEFSHPGQDRTPTDLNHAIANTIMVTTNEWKYVATIDTDLDATLPPVPVIPGEFNQVILNIIVNAAQAIGEARAAARAGKGTIRVVTRHSAQWAEVRITDDGCGMPPHVQRRIFDPFFTTKPVGKGTGQGLSIAHNVIVTKHRGSISVSSEPGRGTTFTIRVPLRAEESGQNAA